MDKIYIFGHKIPDTDSVTSAIALANLKIKQGFNASPRVLGDINSETEFVLDYFKFEHPEYLNDVKLQIKNINYQKNCFLHMNDSIFTAYKYMNESHISNLPIVNDNKVFKGIISMKDIAKDHIEGDFYKLHTSYENILNTLNGIEILRFDNEITGQIIAPSYNLTTLIKNITIDNNSILIMGDRQNLHEYAILNMSKLIILTNKTFIKEKYLQMAKKNKVNIIKTPYDTFKVSKLIHLCNYIKTISKTSNVIYVNELDTIDNFEEIANKTKYSNYPVLNKQKQCLGIIHLSDLSEKKPKRVILVDHNEIEQSALGLEEADILEIIDHHKIGTIGTSLPINFRNMPVGSTNTIIYLLYQESKIEIDSRIAGLMQAGIISDTLLLTSPTTTQLDIDVLKKLSAISNVNNKILANKMFTAASSLKGKTKKEIIYSDFKKVTIKDSLFGIGQIITTNPKDIEKDLKQYVNLIQNQAKKGEYKVFAIFITDIFNKGSYILFNKEAKDILCEAFKLANLEQWTFLPNCLSRKKQIVPNLMNVIKSK